MSLRLLPMVFVWIIVALGCSHSQDTTHEHGHDANHGTGHEAAEPEPLAITAWTAHDELFVEFPPPIAGKPVSYHAHVTELEGFQAVTTGTFRVRYKRGADVASEASIAGVKRPGIFVFEGAAPAAGTYQLEMTYEHDGKNEVFDCGPITVTDKLPAAAPEAPSSAITFLKESQWKLPFATAWAEERPIAKEIELAATVEPAATDQLTIAAPTAGRFFHDSKHPPAEGLRIAKGDILGTIAPTVTGDDFVELQSAVEENRIAKTQVEREIDRITPLVEQKLLPEKRLIELRNERDVLASKLRLAGGRLGRVMAPGGAGSIPIKSSLEGETIIAEVLVRNGEPVEAGAPLVRVGGGRHLWIRARFVARPPSSLVDATASGVRLMNGERIDLEKHGGRLLSALPVVDPSSRIATWIVDAGAAEGMQVGTTLVLLVRTGAPRTTLAVPRDAVVDINTRSFVFVQVDGEHFEKRAVTLGDTDGAFVEITSGIAKAERIVIRGGYDIHLAALMGTIESHRH